MNQSYLRLAVMTMLSFVSMYVLMYAMVNVFANVYPNTNQFYMAGLMTAPMVLLELLVMGRMYANKALNMILMFCAGVALIGFFFLIRFQAGISDRDFLRSMIPHHAGAILMCKEAKLSDPQVKQLCANILSGQQAEIDWMKAKLTALP